LLYAIALHFVYYNFVKIHKSLSITPAMQAGLTKSLIGIEDIAMIVIDKVTKELGPYKKANGTT
jgi:hypothetical protein